MTSLDWDPEIPDALLEALADAALVDPDRISEHARAGRGYDDPGDTLRPRELDLLRCLSHGMTVEMAADTLGITFETARQHARGARYVLRAKTQTQAVAVAIRRGLIA